MSPLTIYNNTQPWTYSIFQIDNSLIPPPPTHPIKHNPAPPNEQTHQLILAAILFASLVGVLILLLSLLLASISPCKYHPKRKQCGIDGWEEIEDGEGGWEEIEYDPSSHKEVLARSLQDRVEGRSLGSIVGEWREGFLGGERMLISRRERERGRGRGDEERYVFVVEVETPEEGYVSGSDEEGYEASNEDELGGEMSELIERRRRRMESYGAVWMEN